MTDPRRREVLNWWRNALAWHKVPNKFRDEAINLMVPRGSFAISEFIKLCSNDKFEELYRTYLFALLEGAPE